jgi:hypothetical protein
LRPIARKTPVWNLGRAGAVVPLSILFRSRSDSIARPVRGAAAQLLTGISGNIAPFIYCGIIVVDSFSEPMRHLSNHAAGASRRGFGSGPLPIRADGFARDRARVPTVLQL